MVEMDVIDALIIGVVLGIAQAMGNYFWAKYLVKKIEAALEKKDDGQKKFSIGLSDVFWWRR